jgi:hypothetical protein
VPAAEVTADDAPDVVQELLGQRRVEPELGKRASRSSLLKAAASLPPTRYVSGSPGARRGSAKLPTTISPRRSPYWASLRPTGCLLGGQPTTWIDRATTPGTVFVHAGNDLLGYANVDSTAARLAPQLLDWARAEGGR